MPDNKSPMLPRKEFENEIIIKAWKDPAFAEELRANPREVLQREMDRLRPGSSIPEDMKVQIVEEGRDTMYLVLPPRPAGIAGDSSDELSDAELEMVAGGGPTCSGCGTNTCGTCLLGGCSRSGIIFF